MIPPTILPAPRRVRRKRRTPSASEAPVQPLTLVAASYDPNVGEFVTLTFSRAVDVSAFDGSQVTLDDNIVTGNRYNGIPGATVISPTVIEVALNPIDSAEGEGVVLNATSGTGIVAADDGAEWAGVSGLELPFP